MKGPSETVADRAVSDRIHNADIPAPPPPGKRLRKSTRHFALRIIPKFLIGETPTFVQNAAKCKLGENETRRLLRNAITYNIFEKQQPGIVAHTATSRALLEVPVLPDRFGLILDGMWSS